MTYYDRLPRSVRHVVANARFDWALRQWLGRFERSEISAKELAAHVATTDRARAASTRRQVWGEHYPITRGGLPTPTRRHS